MALGCVAINGVFMTASPPPSETPRPAPSRMGDIVTEICDYFESELSADDAEHHHKEAVAKIIERHRSAPSATPK